MAKPYSAILFTSLLLILIGLSSATEAVSRQVKTYVCSSGLSSDDMTPNQSRAMYTRLASGGIKLSVSVAIIWPSGKQYSFGSCYTSFEKGAIPKSNVISCKSEGLITRLNLSRNEIETIDSKLEKKTNAIRCVLGQEIGLEEFNSFRKESKMFPSMIKKVLTDKTFLPRMTQKLNDAFKELVE